MGEELEAERLMTSLGLHCSICGRASQLEQSWGCWPECHAASQGGEGSRETAGSALTLPAAQDLVRGRGLETAL